VGEWEVRKLGDCCFSLDYGMNAAATIFDGENKYIRITDIDDTSLKYKSGDPVSPTGYLDEKYLVNNNDILLARTGASTGKSYLYDSSDGKLYFAGFLIRARIKDDYNSKFIFFQTQTQGYNKWIKIMSMRSGQPGINSQEYASFNFFIPQIKNEQDKIVDFLSLIDKKILSQSKIIEELETLINGVYQEIFDVSKNEFQHMCLKSLASVKKGQQINASELSTNGTYYVINGGILPSGYHSEYNTEAGTISISEGGNSCGYVQYNYTEFWSGGHCYTLNKINSVIINKYLYHYLKANEIKIMALRVGSGLPNIQKSMLENFEVKIPTISDQKKIVAILDILTNKLFIDKQLHSMYQQKKKYFLHNIFA
jgi:type I restriction enzyme S subunit